MSSNFWGVTLDLLVAVYQHILHKVSKQRKPQVETEFGQIKGPKMESRKYWYSLRLLINPRVPQQQTYLVTNQLSKIILTDKLTTWIRVFLETLITSQPSKKFSACKERAI